MAAHRVDGHQGICQLDLTQKLGNRCDFVGLLLGGYLTRAAIPSSLAQALRLCRGPCPCPAAGEAGPVWPSMATMAAGAIGVDGVADPVLEALWKACGCSAISRRRMQSREGIPLARGRNRAQPVVAVIAQRWMAVGAIAAADHAADSDHYDIDGRCWCCACAGGQRGTQSTSRWLRRSPICSFIRCRARPRQVIHDHPTGENRSHL